MLVCYMYSHVYSNMSVGVFYIIILKHKMWSSVFFLEIKVVVEIV